jgi:hypothetical protein
MVGYGIDIKLSPRMLSKGRQTANATSPHELTSSISGHAPPSVRS